MESSGDLSIIINILLNQFIPAIFLQLDQFDYNSIQVVNMWSIGKCDGSNLTFYYTTDQLSLFRYSQFDEQITIESLLYEISITTTVGFTALLMICWLVGTGCSTATHSCISTVFMVGYPTLWTVLKLHGLKTQQEEAERFLWFILPICVPVIISGAVLFYVKYRVRVFPRRELSRATITKVGLMANSIYFLLIVMNLIAKQEPRMIRQLYLALYYTTTRALPLVNAGKTLIFVCEERSFAKDLMARIKNSFCRPCLCVEGVYLDQ